MSTQPDPTYIPDAAQITVHERLNKEPATKFISSNKPGSSDLVHIGLRKELRGARSGLISMVYYVTACSGKQLGSAWGQSETNELPADAHFCPRCATISRAQASA